MLYLLSYWSICALSFIKDQSCFGYDWFHLKPFISSQHTQYSISAVLCKVGLTKKFQVGFFFFFTPTFHLFNFVFIFLHKVSSNSRQVLFALNFGFEQSVQQSSIPNLLVCCSIRLKLIFSILFVISSIIWKSTFHPSILYLQNFSKNFCV